MIKGRGMDFLWARTYRSKAGQDTAIGNGWSFSYDIRVVANGSFFDVYDGTGRKDTYRPQTNGDRYFFHPGNNLDPSWCPCCLKRQHSG